SGSGLCGLTRCGLNKKTASRLAVSLRLLFVSVPPDRLGRGIKAAKEEQRGQVHVRQSTKTCVAAPTTRPIAGMRLARRSATPADPHVLPFVGTTCLQAFPH